MKKNQVEPVKPEVDFSDPRIQLLRAEAGFPPTEEARYGQRYLSTSQGVVPISFTNPIISGRREYNFIRPQ